MVWAKKMKVEDAKKWAGKEVTIKTKRGFSHEGKITNVCNEYCDKWMFYFDDMSAVDVDSIKTIVAK